MPKKIPPRKGESPNVGQASDEQMNPVDDPVGLALRRLHDEVVAEPLPEDFLRLLGEIERKISGQAGNE